MSIQDNAKIAQTIYDVYNSRDFDRGAALVAQDIELVNMPLGVTLRGPDGYRQYVQGWAMAFPDSKVEISHRVVSEEGFVTEFHGRGTHTGPLVGPAGEILATGKAVDIPFCEVMQVKNDKISSIHTYYDAATLMGQLGLMG